MLQAGEEGGEVTAKHTPRAGSIGERSMRHLAEHGRVKSRDLAVAIDADVALIDASLNLCVEHGLVTRETDPDGTIFYTSAVTLGFEPADPADDVPSEPRHQLRPALPALDRRNRERRQGWPHGVTEEARHFAIGLFSDGRFVIEVGEGLQTLTRAETEKLFAFVQKIETIGDAG